jgi:hypothetical protein
MQNLVLWIVTLGLLMPVGVHASSITIFNTGVDSLFALLPGGSIDPHYELFSSPDVRFPGPAAVVATAIPESWVSNGPSSSWITPTADSPQSFGYAPGTYIYRTTFDLTGFNPASAVLTGTLSGDDDATVTLNGTSLGLMSPVGGWTSFSPFTISSGFIAGVNTLSFRLMNVGGPTGLRVEISGTADVTGGGAAVPEPSAWTLTALSIPLLVFVKLRVRTRN